MQSKIIAISLGLKLILKSDWIALCVHSVMTFADICFQSFRGEYIIMEPDAYCL